MVLASRRSALAGEIGQRIRERRKQLGLTQEKTAELSGLSQRYIANVESGKRGLGDDSIIGLAQALQVSADYLLFGRASEFNHDPITELLQSLNADQLLDVQQIIKIYVDACNRAQS